MKTYPLLTNLDEELLGPKILKLKVHKDKRGFFLESWNQDQLNKVLNEDINFVQDNHSFSNKGVLRGLHYQTKPKGQAKLVRCIQGEIFDVIVDIRINSKTFGKWAGLKLNETNTLLWVPKGFAHGFLTLSNYAEVCYKTSNYWDSESEKTINWEDPDISIKWPNICSKFIISDKDKSGSFLKNLLHKDLY